MKRKMHKVRVARRPANPQALASGSGFHSPAKYGKKDRKVGKEYVVED